MKERYVYKTLRMKMYEAGIDSQTLAMEMGLPYTNLRRRLRGENSFTVEEAICLHKFVGQDISIEQLFERSDAS